MYAFRGAVLRAAHDIAGNLAAFADQGCRAGRDDVSPWERLPGAVGMAAEHAASDLSESRADGSVGSLIDRWQCGRDPDALAALVAQIRLPIERLVARALGRHGIRDPGARDDAWALIIEHLARLGNDAAAADDVDGDRDRGLPRVGGFDATRAAGAATDAGWAFIRCLARSRAGDVARSWKRQVRRERRWIDAAEAATPTSFANPAADDDAARQEDSVADADRLRAAMATLDGRSRTVVALLLQGKSQVVVAHAIGVCEGTVSRIRVRAIARLRTLLAE